MFTSTVILLIPFLVVTFLPLAITTISSDELDRMGVQLENAQMSGNRSERSKYILPRVNVMCGNA